jgi:hypothetical protein
MEQTFALRCKSAIDLGLSNDQLVPTLIMDILRAATLLAGWLWGHNLEAQATIMTSTAVRYVNLLLSVI